MYRVCGCLPGRPAVSIYKQTDFGELPPISKRRDPVTSKIAEFRQDQGKRQKRLSQVLMLVGQFPDQTGGEYGELMRAAHTQLPMKVALDTPAKRISDLLAKGLVEVTGMRNSRDTNQPQRTYQLTGAGQRWFRTQ